MDRKIKVFVRLAPSENEKYAEKYCVSASDLRSRSKSPSSAPPPVYTSSRARSPVPCTSSSSSDHKLISKTSTVGSSSSITISGSSRIPRGITGSSSKMVMTGGGNNNIDNNNSSNSSCSTPSPKQISAQRGVIKLDEATVKICKPEGNTRTSEKLFHFDKVFSEKSTQSQMYHSVESTVASVLDGQNVTLVTYGAANSGKTYTLHGDKYNAGIVPNSIRTLFKQLEKRKDSDVDDYYYLEMSFVELYNNKILNLVKDTTVNNWEGDYEESVVNITDSADFGDFGDAALEVMNTTDSHGNSSSSNSGGQGHGHSHTHSKGSATISPTTSIAARKEGGKNNCNNRSSSNLSSYSGDSFTKSPTATATAPHTSSFMRGRGSNASNSRSFNAGHNNSSQQTFTGNSTSVHVGHSTSISAASRNQSLPAEKIDVRESRTYGVFLAGGTTLRTHITNVDDAITLYNRALQNRSTRALNSVYASSRSHAIFTIYIEKRTFSQNDNSNIAEPELELSRIHFIDLAGPGTDKLSVTKGNEISTSGSAKKDVSAMVESQNINSSLSALADVLASLVKKSASASASSSSSSSASAFNTPTASNSKSAFQMVLPHGRTLGDLNIEKEGKQQEGISNNDNNRPTITPVRQSLIPSAIVTPVSHSTTLTTPTSSFSSAVRSKSPNNNSNYNSSSSVRPKSPGISHGGGFGSSVSRSKSPMTHGSKSSSPRSSLDKSPGSSTGTGAHVPFYNSKLTHLLKDSLDGSSEMIFITTVNTSVDYHYLNNTTLSLAEQLMKIKPLAANNLSPSKGKPIDGSGYRWQDDKDPESIRLRKIMDLRSLEIEQARKGRHNTTGATTDGTGTSTATPEVKKGPTWTSVPDLVQKGGVGGWCSHCVDMEKENTELKAQFEEKSDLIMELIAKIKQSKTELQISRKQAAEKLERVTDEFVADNEQLRVKIKGLEAQLHSKASDVEELSEDFVKLFNEKNESEQSMQNLLVQKDDTFSDTINSVEDLKRQLASTQQSLHAANQFIEHLKCEQAEELKEANGKLEEFSQYSSILLEQIQEQDKDIEELTASQQASLFHYASKEEEIKQMEENVLAYHNEELASHEVILRLTEENAEQAAVIQRMEKTILRMHEELRGRIEKQEQAASDIGDLVALQSVAEAKDAKQNKVIRILQDMRVEMESQLKIVTSKLADEVTHSERRNMLCEDLTHDLIRRLEELDDNEIQMDLAEKKMIEQHEMIELLNRQKATLVAAIEDMERKNDILLANSIRQNAKVNPTNSGAGYSSSSSSRNSSNSGLKERRRSDIGFSSTSSTSSSSSSTSSSSSASSNKNSVSPTNTSKQLTRGMSNSSIKSTGSGCASTTLLSEEDSYYLSPPPLSSLSSPLASTSNNKNNTQEVESPGSVLIQAAATAAAANHHTTVSSSNSNSNSYNNDSGRNNASVNSSLDTSSISSSGTTANSSSSTARTSSIPHYMQNTTTRTVKLKKESSDRDRLGAAAAVVVARGGGAAAAGGGGAGGMTSAASNLTPSGSSGGSGSNSISRASLGGGGNRTLSYSKPTKSLTARRQSLGL